MVATTGWERWLTLAPAFVIGAGALLGAVVLLTYLGVNLPKE